MSARTTERVPPHDLDAERAAIGAMLLAREARVDALAACGPSDFYSPKHQMIVAKIAALHGTGEVVDVVSVAAELGQGDWTEMLLDAQMAVPAISHAGRYASIVAETSARRQLIMLAAEMTEQAYTGAELGSIIDSAQGRLVETTLRAHADNDPLDKLTTFEQFRIRAKDTPVAMAISRVLARRERALFVSGEGSGKSVLLRQIAIAIGGGVHPFTQAPHEQLPTLYVELENSERTIVSQASLSLDGASRILQAPNDAWILHEEGGLNLRSTKDQVYLEKAMQLVRPAILLIGPIYKAARKRANEDWETAAMDLIAVLDDFRTRFDCALIMEHHAPRGSGIRELVPFGSTAWQRWPEFGLKLEPEGVDRQGRPTVLNVGHFRGDRVDADWPERLVRGGSGNLPWLSQPRPR